MADRYCVIGNPVAHSKSPEIHAAFARGCGIDLTYEKCLAPLDGFAETVRGLVAQGYKGANVTVPFKLEAAQLCDVLRPRAEAAGAVNTLLFIDGHIEGDNTDGAGLVADIVRNAGVPLKDKRVLLLGAGGAARGVLLPLLAEGPREIVIANRTVATAESLAERFAQAGPVRACGFDAIDGAFDVVVNATAASLAAEVPPVPPHAFCTSTLALDMMYGKQPTVFMQFAATHGAQVRDGLGMLVEQAAEAFYAWRGVRPATQGILRQLRTQL